MMNYIHLEVSQSDTPLLLELVQKLDARVITVSENNLSDIASKKEKLRSIFKRMQQHDVFKSIANPTSWQKKLRNEWE